MCCEDVSFLILFRQSSAVTMQQLGTEYVGIFTTLPSRYGLFSTKIFVVKIRYLSSVKALKAVPRLNAVCQNLMVYFVMKYMCLGGTVIM